MRKKHFEKKFRKLLKLRKFRKLLKLKNFEFFKIVKSSHHKKMLVKFQKIVYYTSNISKEILKFSEGCFFFVSKIFLNVAKIVFFSSFSTFFFVEYHYSIT